jgi:hypothetical protein
MHSLWCSIPPTAWPVVASCTLLLRLCSASIVYALFCALKYQAGATVHPTPDSSHRASMFAEAVVPPANSVCSCYSRVI